MQLLVHRELLRVALNHFRHRVGAFPVQLLTALSTLGRERVVLAARRLHVAGANQLKGQEEERKLPRPGEENNGDHGARPDATRVTEPIELHGRTNQREQRHGTSLKRDAGGPIQQVGRAARLVVPHDQRAKRGNHHEAGQVDDEENNRCRDQQQPL